MKVKESFDGFTVEQIDLGCRYACYNHPNSKYSGEAGRIIGRMYKHGMTANEIGDVIGLSSGRTIQVLQDLGRCVEDVITRGLDSKKIDEMIAESKKPTRRDIIKMLKTSKDYLEQQY